jgi:uncharacterized protein YidB (DUF937 family)
MGLLDGLVGGTVGAEMASVVSHAIDSHGGLSGLVAQFQQHGLGGVVQSWVGTGPNQAISADQLHKVLGSATVQQMAAKFGINPEVLLQQLSQVLPQAVDKLTPNGTLPRP